MYLGKIVEISPATDIGRTDKPPLVQHGSLGHLAACHHPLSMGVDAGQGALEAVTVRQKELWRPAKGRLAAVAHRLMPSAS